MESRCHLDSQALSTIVPFRSHADDQIRVGNKTYFRTIVGPDASSQIGVTDGTVAGTRLIPGTFPLSTLDDLQFKNINGKVYFIGSQPGTSYRALYRVADGDTGLIRLNTASQLEQVEEITGFNGKVFFRAYSSARGWELFETAGIPSSTRLSFELAPGTASGVAHCEAMDNKLFLFRTEAWQTIVYTSDGTREGTVEIARIDSPYEPHDLMHTPNGVAFVCGNELWVTNGTSAGTRRIHALGGDDHDRYRSVAWTGEFAVFTKKQIGGASHLWRTDGTTAGTVDLGVGFQDYYGGGNLVAVGDAVFATGATGLIRIDGSSVNSGFGIEGRYFIAGDDSVFFNASGIALGADYLGGVSSEQAASVKLLADGINGKPLHIAGENVVISTATGIYLVSTTGTELPSLSGQVFNDLNADGSYQAGEPAFLGGTVFVDLDSDGVRDGNAESVIPVATDGTFTLRWTRLGNYAISYEAQSPPAYRIATTPTSWPLMVTGAEVLPVIHVGYHNKNTRTGKVINDLNGDDAANIGEPGVAAVRVYADANNNAVLDPGEATSVTDANGNWTIDDLLVGSHVLRIVVPDGWYSSFPYSETITTVATAEGGIASLASFGISQTPPRNLITGRIFEDRDGNGAYNTGDMSYGGTVWNDLNSNGVLDTGEPNVVSASGTFSLFSTVGLQTLRVWPALADWTQSGGLGTFSLSPGERRFDYGLPIAIAPIQGNSVTGNLFRDSNLNGMRDNGELPLIRRVGLDLDGDGFIASGEPVRQADATGRFRFNNVSPGSYGLKIIVDSLLFQPSSPVNSAIYPVMVHQGAAIDDIEMGGETVTGFNFASNSVNARVFLDSNRNGTRDANESTYSGAVTFIDLNGNGVQDSYFGFAEPRFTGSAWSLASNFYRFVTALPTGWILVNGNGLPYRELFVGEPMTIDMPLYRPRATTEIQFDPNTRILQVHLSTAQVPGTPVTAMRIVDAHGQLVPNVSFINAYQYRTPISLPDGQYFVEVDGAILAAFDEDPAQVPDVVLSFRMLRGDADNSGMVDFSDLLILAQNFGRTGRSFSQGNFNYDASGRVDFDDLLLLAQNYMSNETLNSSRSRAHSVRSQIIRVV